MPGTHRADGHVGDAVDGEAQHEAPRAARDVRRARRLHHLPPPPPCSPLSRATTPPPAPLALCFRKQGRATSLPPARAAAAWLRGARPVLCWRRDTLASRLSCHGRRRECLQCGSEAASGSGSASTPRWLRGSQTSMRKHKPMARLTRYCHGSCRTTPYFAVLALR